MELIGQHKAWDELDTRLWKEIQEKGARVYKPDELQHTDLNSSLVIKIPDRVNLEIFQKLQDSIPSNIKPKIQFQPWEWYHLTIQWSPEKEIEEAKKTQLYTNLRRLIAKYPSIRGSFQFPFLGNGGPWGVFFSEEDGLIARLKERSTEVWKALEIKPFVPPIYYETNYISLSRFIQAPTVEELQTLKQLPLIKVENIILDRLLLIRNDKVMTPDRIEILVDEKLKAS